MSRLRPTLREIEDWLFDPSRELIARWIAQDPPLPEETRRDLDEDPRARFLRDLQEQEAGEPRGFETQTTGEFRLALAEDEPLPGRIADLIRRHVATRDCFAGARDGVAGQMRLVSRLMGIDGVPLDWDMGRPLAVLLWRETETPGVWSGWLLAGETDYATDWDILLEEQDEPHEAMVSMVQLWNPVQIALDDASPVIGQVSSRRLKTLANTFADSLLAAEAMPIPAHPGRLMERLASNGELLLCGTPLGGPKDPRRRYQQLYFAAAGILKESAKLAVAARAGAVDRVASPAPVDWAAATWGRISSRLWGLADQFGKALLSPEPVVAMGIASRGETISRALEDQFRGYRIPGLVAIEYLPQETHGVLKIRLTHLGKESLTLRLLLDGDALEVHRLGADKSEVILYIAPQAGLALEVQDSGGLTHAWNLTP